jgi:hypothetical protein
MIKVLASIWPYRLIRWALAGLFLYASFFKLRDTEAFAEAISEFGVVGENALFATALVIICLEVIAGLGLLLDMRGALGLTIALLLVFVAVLSHGISLGLDISCGCLGPGDSELGLHEALLRDLLLLAACGYLYWSRWVRSSPPLTWRQLREKITRNFGDHEECTL